MRTHALALLAALLLLLGLGAGTAAADEPDAGGRPGWPAASRRRAPTRTQRRSPPRTATSRCGSGARGDNGNVTQTNAAGALALAGNANQTGQSATQTQSGAGTQAVGQAAAQHAGRHGERRGDPDQAVEREHLGADPQPGRRRRRRRRPTPRPPVRPPGTPTARRSPPTSRSPVAAAQQAVVQAADNKQTADADADATQIKPSNQQHLGADRQLRRQRRRQADQRGPRGRAGRQRQRDDQSAAQSQGGGDAAKCGCGHGGDGVQAVGQFADSKQYADADANAKQIKPTNENTSVRIGSHGDDGDVTQTNVAGALGVALNANATEQSADQSQGGAPSSAKCGCYGGRPVQAVGQFADSNQGAKADADDDADRPDERQRPRPHRQPGRQRLRQPDQRSALRGAGREPELHLAVHQPVAGRRRWRAGRGSGGRQQAVGRRGRRHVPGRGEEPQRPGEHRLRPRRHAQCGSRPR